jgi:hypothetical protein
MRSVMLDGIVAFAVGEWTEFGCCFGDDLVDKEALRMALGSEH